jgi:membrane-associated phospholipid phosphatase
VKALGGLAPRFFRFLRRHVWSISLAGLSALAFSELASEIGEGELGPFDETIARGMTAFRMRLDGPMVLLTEVGGGAGMTLLCVASAGLLLSFRKDREASFVLVCGGGAAVLSAGLKLVFQRARPEAALNYLIDAPSSFSFPSGHALGSTCVVGSLAVVAVALLRAWRYRIAAVASASAFIAGVASSRIYLGVHFPSDIVGGVLAGAAWVAAVTGWFYPRLLPGETARRESTSRVRRAIESMKRWRPR